MTGKPQSESLRKEFERWYVQSQQATLGSRDCAMAWMGWQSGYAAALERAAQACEQWNIAIFIPDGCHHEEHGMHDLAEAVRALAGEQAEDGQEKG